MIANRKNGVLVDDEDAENCESNWFSTKTTQKHVQLRMACTHTELVLRTVKYDTVRYDTVN